MSVGILLIQLGTPDAPTSMALRKYLRQFLADSHVIKSAWVRRVIVPLFVLPFRPAQSAAKYQRIWHPVTGSPLLHFTRRQAELLGNEMHDCPVRFAMQIGSPSIRDVVAEMTAAGVDRFIVLPMYPQYSDTTTGSALETLSRISLPAVQIIPPYFSHPSYLNALEKIIQEELSRLTWVPEYFVISFHGIPKQYAIAGDPYAKQVVATTRELVRRLGWRRERWTQSYQSLFGKSVWLKPYTDQVLTNLAKRGIKRVFVTAPGFTADCLETLDEIGHESTEIFRKAGGEQLHLCPSLNDHPAWIAAMKHIIMDSAGDWLRICPSPPA